MELFQIKPLRVFDDIKPVLIRSAYCTASLVLFIIVFQPFDYNILSFVLKLRILLFVALATFCFSAIHTLLTNGLMNRSNVKYPARWEVLLWLVLTLIVSQLIYVYTIYLNLNDFSVTGVWKYFYSTSTLCSIPLISILLVKSSPAISQRYFRLLRKRKRKGRISIKQRIFCPERILAIKAEDNYIKVFELDESHQKCRVVMLRSTIREAIRRTSGHKQFVQVHRSYVVNLSSIESIQGNSQRCTLRLKSLDEMIPVSRSNSHLFMRGVVR